MLPRQWRMRQGLSSLATLQLSPWALPAPDATDVSVLSRVGPFPAVGVLFA